MAKFIKLFSFLVFVCLMFILNSCTTTSKGGEPSADGEFGELLEPGYYKDGDIMDGGLSGLPGHSSRPGGEGNGNLPRSGQLTACALFDKNEFGYWHNLQLSTDNGDGVFYQYANKYTFNTSHMIKVSSNFGVDAEVVGLHDDEIVYSARTLKDGTAILFDGNEAINKIRFTYVDNSTNEQVVLEKEYNPESEEVVSFDVHNETNNNLIEIMFVVDTTGSMMDEIAYLQSEIDNVVSELKANNEEVNISIALMFYRDKYDEYLTRYFDFSQDIDEIKKNLLNQKADGGGDFEEAVDVAMDEAVNKQWSVNSTKILIHVADAPSHNSDVVSWYASALLAAKKGIRIITVASSGIDKRTEYLFRSQSLLTDGCYVYLTDDSGISVGGHVEATVKERPVVEYLNACLIRLINGYYSGNFAEPVYYGENSKVE